MLDNNIDEKDRIRNRYFRPRKTSIFHSRKKRENRYLEFEEHKPKTYKYYIYIHMRFRLWRMFFANFLGFTLLQCPWRVGEALEVFVSSLSLSLSFSPLPPSACPMPLTCLLFSKTNQKWLCN